MIKGKVLKITENTVYIGYEDGSLKEIPIESCEFEPRMGDYVEAYKSEETYIIAKKSSEVTTEKKKEEKGPLTIKNIKLMAWLGIVLTLLRDPLFFAIPVMMGHLLKEKGEKDSGTFMLGASIFAFITAIIIRFVLTGSFW